MLKFLDSLSAQVKLNQESFKCALGVSQVKQETRAVWEVIVVPQEQNHPVENAVTRMLGMRKKDTLAIFAEITIEIF